MLEGGPMMVSRPGQQAGLPLRQYIVLVWFVQGLSV